ncbi:MAG: choice-of-anchor Q domain-containing protein, partial [Anaerolineae bacterium]|nr:choice-of-anchor Q domain-containing protein [Anaerolineae bacterium]
GQVSFNVVRTFVNNSTVGGGGVWSSGSATLNGVTVTHNLVERNSATTNVTAFGGGIFNSAQLTVNNSRVDFNRAEVDRGAQGGGIYNGDQLSSAGAQLTLQNSTVSTNTAKATFGIATGGGVHSGFVPGDTADVLSSEIRNNVAEGNFGANGGGVRSTGVLTLTSSVVISNAALGTLQPSNGGGVSTQSAPGTVLIADTQILTNLASTGGGWYNDTPGAQMNNSQVRFNTTLASTNPAEHGGGIYNTSPASINNSFITDNKAHEDGGGIYNAGPDVNVFNSEIALNAAGISGLGNGGGAYNAGGMFLNASRVLTNTAPGTGGGIHSGGSGFAFVGVQDSILRANNAGQSGGGLYVAAGSNASVNSSRVLSNTASVNGGGIYNAGTLFTNFSTIGGQNQAQQGGGIYNAAGGDISNAFAITITANSATDGAGLFNAGTVSFFQRSAVVSNTATSNGGGIYNSGTLNSVNNTLSGNGAPNGGGLYAVGGTANLTHTTIASHTSGNGVVVAATVAVSGTLLAYNTPSNCTAAVVNNGGSLSSDSTCGVGTLNTNPLLAPLAFNGGQTLNHALLPGSPALDQTGNCNSYTVFDDQRGVLRPQGTACDIGAFELEEADLEVSKSASPSPVIAGQVITYTVIVTNTSTSGAANNLVLTDTLFGGATFGGVVSSGGFALQSSTSSQAVFTLGSLGAGVSTTLVFTATAPASGPITNVVTVTSGNPDPNPANNTFTVTTQVTPAAYLSVVKSANYAALAPGIIAPSGQLTYIVVVTNNGPSAATLTVTDTLASGVSFVAATINGAPCTFSAPNVVCTTSAAIPAGSAATVLITVTAPATQNTVFTNTATASTPAFPFTPFSSNVVTLTTAGSADLAIFKSAAPSPVLAGQPIVYTVILQNLGPSVATNVVVTDVLQGGATFGNVLLAVGLSLQSSVTNAVTFTVSTLPAGSSVAVVYTVTAPSEGGLVTNTVMAASSTIDPVPTNNTASTTVTVTPVANLQISKAQTFSTTIAGTIPPSGTITYTLQVTNTGPSTASFVTVTDNLPAGLVFVSASGAGWSCSFSAPTVTCTRPTLSVGAAPAIQIVATAPVTPGLVLTNTATVNAATFPNTPVTSNSVSVKVQFRVFAPIVRK